MLAFRDMRALRHLIGLTASHLIRAAALTGFVAAATYATTAEASVSIAVTLDDLTQRADAVAVIVPVEAQSVWEDGKIITYTKVRVEQAVAGGLATSEEAVVRTLGGVVDDIGQQVDGEANLIVGKPSLLFLRKTRTGHAFDVAARAQGQFPIVTTEAAAGVKKPMRRVIRSTNRGVLLPPRAKAAKESKAAGESRVPSQADVSIPKARLAGEALHDRPLDDVTRELADTWRRLHAPPAAAAPRTTP